MKKLRDWLPPEAQECMTDDLRRRLDREVLEEHKGCWPGSEKNVFFWCIIDSGHAVGWNENPNCGWSFPVMKFRRQI